MALIKEIELDSGVTIRYHRVDSIRHYVNKDILIVITSYTSKAKRLEELDKLSRGEQTNIFTESSYISVPYVTNFNVFDAYAAIKQLEKFEGAEDDGEL